MANYAIIKNILTGRNKECLFEIQKILLIFQYVFIFYTIRIDVRIFVINDNVFQ